MATNILLTVVTSHIPSTLAKQYSLDKTGNLSKPKPAGQIVEGSAQRFSIHNAQELADLLVTLQHNQALVYGVAVLEQAKLMSRQALEDAGYPGGVLTRTKEDFAWANGPGVLMVDYDPLDGQPALNRFQFIQAITDVVPELTKSAYVWWCSSSSLLYHDREQLQGIRGQRLYILVEDAQDIERAGSVLFKRLWLAGHGFYAISRAGTALERTIIDASVWQTNRLDFASGAKCIPPLEQRRGEPSTHEGTLLDTAAALPNLTPEEVADYQAVKISALEMVKPNLVEIRNSYVQNEAKKLAGLNTTPQTLEHARATVERAVNSNVLTGDFNITLKNGQKITIGEVLDNPSIYHAQPTLDPLEPEYDGYRFVGKLFLIGSRPTLFSFAHGGATYRLIRQVQRIEHVRGTTSRTTDEALELLRNLPEFFDLGDSIVLVDTGTVHVLDQHSLAYWMGSIAQFYEQRKNQNDTFKEVNIDPRPQTIRQLLSLRKMRRLKSLKAVITAPVLLPSDCRILSNLGYDEKSQLYLDMPDIPPATTTLKSFNEIQNAYQTLMLPFAEFTPATPLDRGVLFAAVLTAIQRPALNTAPAIGIDAPVQGTGKTYLALCLAALATGKTCSIMPPLDHRQDEETRKRISSALAAGERTFIWDNILNDFNSPSLAALLTSETFSDRTLGRTEKPEYPNRMFVLLTGNNLRFANDMPRRVLKLRLDARLENPATRKFNNNPLQFILHNRQKLVQAGLSLIHAYLQSSEFAAGGAVLDESTASFEEWDQCIRQTVAWLAIHHKHLELVDPGEAIKEASSHDPELEVLSQTLEIIHSYIGDDWFEARKLVPLIVDGLEPLKKNNMLKELLHELAPGANLSAHSIGRILSRRADRIVNGYHLRKHQNKSRTLFQVFKQNVLKTV